MYVSFDSSRWLALQGGYKISGFCENHDGVYYKNGKKHKIQDFRPAAFSNEGGDMYYQAVSVELQLCI